MKVVNFLSESENTLDIRIMRELSYPRSAASSQSGLTHGASVPALCKNGAKYSTPSASSPHTTTCHITQKILLHKTLTSTLGFTRQVFLNMNIRPFIFWHFENSSYFLTVLNHSKLKVIHFDNILILPLELHPHQIIKKISKSLTFDWSALRT